MRIEYTVSQSTATPIRETSMPANPVLSLSMDRAWITSSGRSRRGISPDMATM